MINQDLELIREISGTNPNKCMKCGKCSASCPSYDDMDIKPHQFVSYVVRGDVEALVKSKSLWRCLTCLTCVERCPRGVKPGAVIDGARQAALRSRDGEYLEPENVDAGDAPPQLLVSAFRRYRR